VKAHPSHAAASGRKIEPMTMQVMRALWKESPKIQKNGIISSDSMGGQWSSWRMMSGGPGSK